MNDLQGLDLLTLPFKAQYKVLSFYGAADNTILNKDFSDVDLIGRELIIKSFKIVNYAQEPTIDFELSDGTKETIPIGYRLPRLIDRWGTGTTITFLINNSNLPLFNNVAGLSHLPADLSLDNIFYHYSQKVQTINLRIFSQVLTTYVPAFGNPLVKVIVECYIF